MSNKLVREQLIHIYGNTCFLGGTPTPENFLTLHHISPARDGRITTIENGALITLNMHWLFNIIEREDPNMAEYINKYLVYYKETMDDEARMIIHQLFIEYAEQRKHLLIINQEKAEVKAPILVLKKSMLYQM